MKVTNHNLSSRRRTVVGGAYMVGCILAFTSTTSNAQQQTSNRVIKTAQKAFDHFSQGIASGNWQPLLDMLTDDCTARIPVAKFKTENSGKNTIAAYFRFLSQELKIKAILTPVSVTSNQNTVGFEFTVKGTAAGKPTSTHNTVFFDVRGDKVSGFREYFG